MPWIRWRIPSLASLSASVISKTDSATLQLSASRPPLCAQLRVGRWAEWARYRPALDPMPPSDVGSCAHRRLAFLNRIAVEDAPKNIVRDAVICVAPTLGILVAPNVSACSAQWSSTTAPASPIAC
ncbi:hypothetical protein QBC34DRAFT_403950 [Podospora aff. communis PSN243]|uniref:Uncharacterized protein n=1 Tax=Podospora aff. communis PSN243 TaxID=3040156 RepID=A0AAV9GP15_9PEZI|nr:hypothetical protein QBC34DRAFT_403950 [Podospora aff. communis PSN243]